MGRIYLVRHGQTTANRERVLQGPRIDAELSDVGLRQADSLGSALADAGITALYCSPLRRARQTADAIAARHRHAGRTPSPEALAIQVVPDLYEMDYGHLVGQSYDEVKPTVEQVLDAWSMGFVHEPFPGGESAFLAHARIRPFAARVAAEARTHDVGVVAHGRINRVLLATWTGAGLSRLEDFPQSNACINRLEVGPQGAQVIDLNDTSHLDEPTEAFA